jgi:hypothetical protein
VGTAFSRPPGDLPGDLDHAPGEAAVRQASWPRTHQDMMGQSQPYPPSWIDKLTDWVRRLPVPSWVFYLALGLSLSLLYLALLLSSVQWAIGGLSLTTVLVYSLLNGLTCAYLLGLIHYLDNSAAAALARFRPVLAADDAEYTRLSYQLTTLPARPTLIAAGLGGLYTFVAQLINVLTTASQVTIAESPILLGLIVGFNLVLYVLAAVLVYHTLHQLLMVNTIYTRHTRINLFQLGPLYALSGLTARTALGIGIPAYIWFQANSVSIQGMTIPDIIQAVFLGVIVVVAFIWPLGGAHRLLETEKQRLQDDVAGRIEATIATLHRRADSGELDNFAAQKSVLDGLLAEQGVIDKLRTWPWRTETVRGLGVAFFLPIVIWLVQRILERLGM